MPIEANSPALLELVDEAAFPERLCTGFQFVEGPIWNPKEQCLYFSDIPAGIRYRWHPDTGATEARNPSNRANGMTYDGAGNLYICEHNTSMLIRETPSGERHVVMGSREPTRSPHCFWCKFEERPGPAPSG